MTAVISKTGMYLMPTNSYRARKLLKSGRAKIFKYEPFTIQLTDRETGDVQPVEFKMDTGYQHIGVSICSEKHEYISEQRDLFSDETEKHNDHKKYRRTRRNRLRYRKEKLSNRRRLVVKDGFAPSIRNKRDRHIDIFKMYYSVMPITKAVIEMGEFDTQVLKAVAEGKPLPKGTDYQHGERYGSETLRKAVFMRDGYRCIICHRSAITDGARLHTHHMGYWKGDRSNRMSNLGSVCERCHTSRNHKIGGELYGKEPISVNLSSAAFMNMVRFNMYQKLKEAAPDVEFHMTYGAMTKLQREDLHVKKSHANDAYAMGSFHPKHRSNTVYYKKVRRNNRILSKFYDSVFIDIRTGQKQKGRQLGCERNNRKFPRNNPNNQRIYRGQKISKGRVSIRKNRYPVQSNDIVLYKGKTYVVKGTITCGKYVKFCNNSVNAKITDVTILKHRGGWIRIIG